MQMLEDPGQRGVVPGSQENNNRMSDPETRTVVPAELPLGHMDALPPGTMLGEFELQGLLGVGGFGMVYRGYDHSLHRAVAIKEYMPSALVGRVQGMQVSARSTADAQPFQAGLNSFIAEARLLARFDHPSLVKVYRFWEANNTAYMAMPLYQGMTLKQARSTMGGPPPEEWLRAVLWSVLEALKVLHGNGTLHRDVSPDNIFLQDMGPPVLLDLGSARRAIIDDSHKHTAILKVNYAPIEQYADAQDLREGAWTDLYAVAAVVHGCLCNEAPLPATIRVVRDRMPSFARVAKTVETHFNLPYSPRFIQTIDHALALQPAARPQSVEAFAKQMHLRAPEKIAQFDWRLALGDRTALGDFDESAQDHLPTVPNLVASEKTRPDSAEHVETEVALPKRISPWWWAGSVLVLIIALGFGYKNATTRVKNEAASAPPSSAVPVKTVAQESAPVPAIPPPVPPVDAKARNPDRPKSAVKPETSRAAVEPARPKPRTERRELCADSNILTRSMCIYNECQKPEFVKLPVCVEDRQRWEGRNRFGQP
jgi:serine/threonine protein kinase